IWRGACLDPYLEFPPRSLTVSHAGFSWEWLASYALAAGVFCAIVFLPLSLITGPRNFPRWRSGVAFLALLLSWAISWTRLPFFESIQLETFPILWLAAIVFFNLAIEDLGG